MSANAIKAFGGTPVPMPMPESYQSLQKGVVDGGAFPAETNKGWKLGEVVDYATYSYAAAYTTGLFCRHEQIQVEFHGAQDQKSLRRSTTSGQSNMGKPGTAAMLRAWSFLSDAGQ
jgi:hypothetical protein